MANKLHAFGHSNAVGASHHIERAIAANPEAAHKALGVLPNWAIGEEAKQMRQLFDHYARHEGAHKTISKEMRHMLHGSDGAAVAGRLATGNNWKRWAGAGAGLAAGSVLTGLPLALRALHQRSQGGEAAVRAKKRVKEELSQAEHASNRREQILKELAAQGRA
jgi:hypothetical protein